MSPRVSPEQLGLSKARILAAARTLIVQQGIERLSLRAVARKAGYSPANLYEYFAGKDDLIRTLAAEVSGRLGARMSRIPASTPAAKRLVLLGEAYVEFARESPEDFLMMFTRLPSERRHLTQQPAGASPYGLVLAAVRDGISDGVLHVGTGHGAEDMAYGLWALAHGMAMLQLTHLKGFAADFPAADKKAFKAFVAGFSQSA